jgi:hypothetical protein
MVRTFGCVAGLFLIMGVSGAFAGGVSGTRGHPIPLHRAAGIGGGWWLKVLSVTPNANRQFAKINKQPAPVGAQDFLMALALTYRGGGKADAGDVVGFQLHAEGEHNSSYDPTTDSCGEAPLNPGLGQSGAPPKTSLQQVGYVFSGQSVHGGLCFQIAKNDASTLTLYTGNSSTSALTFPGAKTVWFALR